MKKLFTVAAVAVLGLGVFSGCKKSDSAPAYSMNATINGVKFTSNACYATSLVSNALQVIGGKSSGSSATSFPFISFGITNYSGIGSYDINSTNTTAIDSSTAIAVAVSGTINITSVTPTVVGTFNFTCSDGTTVTNGSFTAQKY